MRTRILRTISVITMLSLLCMMLASCGEKHKPAYFLEAGEDNDLVAAYRAYFELDGNSVKEVKEVRYDLLITGADSLYKQISFKSYYFKASAQTTGPADWSYTESPHDKAKYNKDTLIDFLKKMDIDYTGDLQITILEFDNYTLIEVQNVSGSNVLDTTAAIFNNKKMLSTPSGDTLKSVWKVYKLEK